MRRATNCRTSRQDLDRANRGNSTQHGARNEIVDRWSRRAPAYDRASAAAQQIEIVDAWARATPPGVETAAAYLKIDNVGEADRLVAARSPASREVQIHDTVREGGLVRMLQLDALPLPAASVTELAPGGRHLMFMDIVAPFVPGRTIEVTLVLSILASGPS